MQEEVAEEEPTQEEEQSVEEEQEEVAEEDEGFSDECTLQGNVYRIQSECTYPLICFSRAQDNQETIPETGFCGKFCAVHSNCESGVCVVNGVVPGIGYCQQ